MRGRRTRGGCVHEAALVPSPGLEVLERAESRIGGRRGRIAARGLVVKRRERRGPGRRLGHVALAQGLGLEREHEPVRCLALGFALFCCLSSATMRLDYYFYVGNRNSFTSNQLLGPVGGIICILVHVHHVRFK